MGCAIVDNVSTAGGGTFDWDRNGSYTVTTTASEVTGWKGGNYYTRTTIPLPLPEPEKERPSLYFCVQIKNILKSILRPELAFSGGPVPSVGYHRRIARAEYSGRNFKRMR